MNASTTEETSLFDAWFAPWVLAGVPGGALRSLARELRDKLGALGARCGEPRFAVDDAIAAVEVLRDAAGIDAREALAEPGALSADLRNAAAHALRLAEAWCQTRGEEDLSERATAYFLTRADPATLGIVNAEGWAEFLVRSRAVQIPVDGRFGPRLLRLVPGPVDDLGADAWVVSGTPWKKPGFNGRAHRALNERFGALDDSWGKILATGPESAFWPTSVEDRSDRPGYSDFYQQCGVWHRPVPWGDSGASPCQHLFYIRVFPLSDARIGEDAAQVAVGAMMKALFAAIAVVGATCDGTPPVTVRMTLVGGRQRDKGTVEEMAAARKEHMSLLVTEACGLLERSPVVQRLDICFFDEGERRWFELKDTWQDLLEDRNREDRADTQPDETAQLLRARCARAVEDLMSIKNLDPSVREALAGLHDCLGRSPRPAARDLGFHSRRTVEALVAGLCRKYNQKPGEILEKNIDLLRDRGKFSRWFLSYLQTLRVLGNEAVHVSARHAIPGELVLADEYVLLSSMSRVLTIARETPP